MKKFLRTAITLICATFCGLTLNACGILDGIFGVDLLEEHEHEYSQTTVEPTCTANGYTLYECECGDRYTDNTVPALGHSFGDGGEYKQPTCTESGGLFRTCLRCGNKIADDASSAPPTGHSPVTDQAVTATCAHTGLTEGSHCGTCGTVLVAQTTIPRGEHVDKQHDGVCDVCGTRFATVTSISDVDGLKAIADDLNGQYCLTKDISLSGVDWVALGTAAVPFSGTLYGNGYTISGLSMSDKGVAGLFAYNSGTIAELKLSDCDFRLSNTDGTLGGIAAYNTGTVSDCSLIGNNKYTFTARSVKNTGYPSYNGGHDSYTGVMGGLVGNNTGTVRNCTVSGVLTCYMGNTCEYYLKPNGLFFLDSSYSHICSATYYFGGVAAINKGTVANCTVPASNTVNIELRAKITKKGIAYAKSYAYVGALVGKNETQSALIKNSKAKKAAFVIQTDGQSISSNGYNGISCELARYTDQTYTDIIGNNSGKIDTVTYL